jgi:hypothetical protein
MTWVFCDADTLNIWFSTSKPAQRSDGPCLEPDALLAPGYYWVEAPTPAPEKRLMDLDYFNIISDF